MKRSELDALLTPAGLALLDETGALRTTDEVAVAVSRLRAAGHPPDLVAAVVTQARLRERAGAKFGPFAERMLFTRDGLEQATRLEVAALHAGRFQSVGIERVADLGCGIGGDAMAFAGLGLAVEAVDAEEVTAAVAAYNLAPFGESVSVTVGRAEASDLSRVGGVWLDPARRRGSQRVASSEWSPPLDWVFATAAAHDTGVKLGPGMDRALIPPGVEAQWTSVDGSTVELVVWSRRLARPGVGRAALVVRHGTASELTAAADSPDEPVRTIGEYLYEPDGAVIRARLIGDLARSMDAAPVEPGVAYLTSDSPAASPFAAGFRMLEEVPADAKGLGAVLRTRGVGTVELKKRGIDIDPAVLRPKLKLRGDRSATVILTRIAGRRRAFLVERMPGA